MNANIPIPFMRDSKSYLRERLTEAAAIMTAARLGKPVGISNLNEAAWTLHCVSEFLSICGLPLAEQVSREAKSEELFLLNRAEQAGDIEREL